MNHGDDDSDYKEYNDNDEGNDDQFELFVDIGEIYNVLIQCPEMYNVRKDVQRSQTNYCNSELKCSIIHHGFTNHKAYISHISDPNIF